MSTDRSPSGRVEAASTAGRPWAGWVLIISGALASVGAFLTWETAGGGVTRLTGIDEVDGWVPFWLGLVLVAAGLVVAARRGRRWVCVVAGVAAVAIAVVFRLDENGVRTSTEPGATVGTGLWLVGIAALLGLAASVAASAAGFTPRFRRGRSHPGNQHDAAHRPL